jgi:hypothetical protein
MPGPLDVFVEVYDWISSPERHYMRDFTISKTVAKYTELSMNLFEAVKRSI